MMLKITEHCTMGCTHCLNSATPNERHMKEQTLMDSLAFIEKNTASRVLVVSGGEPTEHNCFDTMMKLIIDYGNTHECFIMVIVTTNGEAIIRESEKFKQYVKYSKFALEFQISTDARHYSRHIPDSHPVYNEKGFTFKPNCVTTIYPLGRALDNNLPWDPSIVKSCKCFNVRALAKQIPDATLRSIEVMLAAKGYLCTPHIGVNGEIKLGESDFCSVCASIYDDPKEIIRKIQIFKCNKCEHIDKNLAPAYRQFL